MRPLYERIFKMFSKQNVARLVIKGALGLVISTGIGYAIKAEKVLGIRIDEYFTPPTTIGEN